MSEQKTSMAQAVDVAGVLEEIDAYRPRYKKLDIQAHEEILRGFLARLTPLLAQESDERGGELAELERVRTRLEESLTWVEQARMISLPPDRQRAFEEAAAVEVDVNEGTLRGRLFGGELTDEAKRERLRVASARLAEFSAELASRRRRGALGDPSAWSGCPDHLTPEWVRRWREMERETQGGDLG